MSRTCSSGSSCNNYGSNGGDDGNTANEASSSNNVNDRDFETEGTGTVSSVLRALSLPCTRLGCSDFSIPHQPLESPRSEVGSVLF